MIEITPELKELFENWVNLTPEQKKAANQMLKAMNNSKATPHRKLCAENVTAW